MNDICLCIDLDGFRLEDDFIVREMGLCDKSCLHMGFHHYSHNRKWSTLSKKEQSTVIYVRDMVTGLTFKQDRWNFKEGVLDYKRPWPKMSLRCGSDSRPQNSVW